MLKGEELFDFMKQLCEGSIMKSKPMSLETSVSLYNLFTILRLQSLILKKSMQVCECWSVTVKSNTPEKSNVSYNLGIKMHLEAETM